MSRTVFAGNKNSQYDSGLIVKEVHDFFGQSIRTMDSRTVVDKYYTHFRVTYNGQNQPSLANYYRGTKVHLTKFDVVASPLLDGAYFELRSAPDNQKWVVWYNVDGTSVQPVVADAKYIEVNISSGDTSQVIALATALTINNLFKDYFKVTRTSSTLQILTIGLGEVDLSDEGTTPFTFEQVAGEQELVQKIEIDYDGNGNPYYNGELLRDFSYDIYSGKFIKNPTVTLSDVSVETITVAAPTIQNITLPIAATEYEIVFPLNTYKFMIKMREPKGKVQLSWTENESGTNYLTMLAGSVYTEDTLKLDSVRKLYVQTTHAGTILEILSWV